MKIHSVYDAAFAPYGQVVEGLDFGPLIEKMNAVSDKPAEGTIYAPGDDALEALPIARDIQDSVYGGMPIQVGYCNGNNRTLNCLEYHRGSEVNVAADDAILLLAKLSDIKEGKLDTSLVEAFALPAGAAVLIYETSLHYAPCNGEGNDTGFRVAIVLPKGTNLDKPSIAEKRWEDKLLWASNKWLLAHPASPEAAQGAYVGLVGENIKL